MSKFLEGGGVVLDTPDEIAFFHLLATIGALKLEIKGLKMSRGVSVYATAKRKYKLTGNKQRVLEQLEQLKEQAFNAKRG